MSSLSVLPRAVIELLPHIQAEPPIWLVGGAVRDHLLARETQDYDFAVAGDALSLARRIADVLRGFYYDLDRERGIGRVILVPADGVRRTFDFARLRGATIEDDLRGRDFTANALAVDLSTSSKWIDPLGGAGDIKNRILQPCSSQAILDDPVRALRAVRLSVELGFAMSDETKCQVRLAKEAIDSISPERVRDEVMLLLDMNQPGSGLRLLDHLGITPFVFIEVDNLRDTKLPAPHEYSGVEHTFAVVDRLGELLSVLRPIHDTEASGNLIMAQASLRLGRFREQISEHLNRALSQGRRAQQLLYLAALYHATGASVVEGRAKEMNRDSEKQDSFSADLVKARAQALRLSNAEIELAAQIVRHRHRFERMERNQPATPRSIYRFFRVTRNAGVEIVLLALADFLGTFATPAPQDAWESHVELGKLLLKAVFTEKDSLLNPPTLLSGSELMQDLGLDPGPEVGKLLEAIREAQAAGEVVSREQALEFARKAATDKRSDPA
ncbi:MAG: HD domain-containing protein [Anaerolineales bacterium]|nr:HD domain-containing protein [Anaerolineales bacterium]